MYGPQHHWHHTESVWCQWGPYWRTCWWHYEWSSTRPSAPRCGRRSQRKPSAGKRSIKSNFMLNPAWTSQFWTSNILIDFNLGQLGRIVPVLALRHPRVRQTSIQADLVRCHHVHPVAGGDNGDDGGDGDGGGGDHHHLRHHGHLPVNGLLHLSCMVRVGVVSLSPHACTIIFAINITSSSFPSTLSSLSSIIDDPDVQWSCLGPLNRRLAMARSCQDCLRRSWWWRGCKWDICYDLQVGGKWWWWCRWYRDVCYSYQV